jgi:ADP-heptose:LPS heptosyltransferase
MNLLHSPKPDGLKMQPAEKTGKNLLVVHQGALGDFIVTFPVLRTLRAAFFRIDGICRAEFGHLAKHLAVMDGFFSQDAARFASLYSEEMDPRVTALLKAYDHVLLFSFSETLEESVRRVKKDTVHRIAPWPREEDGIHVTDFLFHRLKESKLPLKAAPTIDTAMHEPPTPTGTREKPESKPRIILSPGAGSRFKRWPLVGYLKVADRLTEIGLRPEFVLGPAERDLESVFSTGPAFAVPVQRPQSLVQLAGVLQSAGAYIGNDSAVSHLAAFLDIPAVVLFGPSNADRWRPIGDRVTVLQAGAASDVRWDKAKTGYSDAHWLEQIPPAIVLKSIRELIPG